VNASTQLGEVTTLTRSRVVSPADVELPRVLVLNDVDVFHQEIASPIYLALLTFKLNVVS
jgi:hypothetical protein